jgi:hypothetical protein
MAVLTYVVMFITVMLMALYVSMLHMRLRP